MGMNRVDVLERALNAIYGDREENYGTPEDNFETIAELWKVLLGGKGTEELDGSDVALMMILLKVARLAADPQHEDSWIDIAGYAACGSEVCSGNG